MCTSITSGLEALAAPLTLSKFMYVLRFRVIIVCHRVLQYLVLLYVVMCFTILFCMLFFTASLRKHQSPPRPVVPHFLTCEAEASEMPAITANPRSENLHNLDHSMRNSGTSPCLEENRPFKVGLCLGRTPQMSFSSRTGRANGSCRRSGHGRRQRRRAARHPGPPPGVRAEQSRHAHSRYAAIARCATISYMPLLTCYDLWAMSCIRAHTHTHHAR